MLRDSPDSRSPVILASGGSGEGPRETAGRSSQSDARGRRKRRRQAQEAEVSGEERQRKSE